MRSLISAHGASHFLLKPSVFLVLLIFSFIVTSSAGAGNISKTFLVEEFERLDQSSEISLAAFESKDGAVLAWEESYRMQAYLEMYEGTGNVDYLDRFVRHADIVVEITDSKRALKDYKGRILVGWGTDRYSKGKNRVIFLVHTGMILHPLVRFADVVSQHPDLRKFRKVSENYVAISVKAMAEFDSNWNFDPISGEGYYQFDVDSPAQGNEGNPPMPVPFNQQLAAGRVFVYLWKVTDNTGYLNKAQALARHFKNRIQRDNQGAYVWRRAYGKAAEVDLSFEDISHGSIDVDFAILAYKNSIVFGKEDMEGFLSTYRHNINGNGSIKSYVHGGGNDGMKQSLGRWVELAQFDCSIYRDYIGIMDLAENKGPTLLHLAEIIKYYDKCN